MCLVYDFSDYFYFLRICSRPYGLRHRYAHPTPEEMWGPLGIVYEISCARRQKLMRLGNGLSASFPGGPRIPIFTQEGDVSRFTDAPLTPTQSFT